MPRSNRTIYIALASNIAIAVTKFIAGTVTKSSAMTSESVHSLVDCINELLLLLGIARSNRPRDKTHPFGYGRELYFWSFIVSLLILGLGAGVSFYQGIVHLNRPTLNGNLITNYIVLLFSFVFDGISFLVSLRQFNAIRGEQDFWTAIRQSKDPASFIILFEDGAAVTGVVIVFACLLTGHFLNNPYFDGIASLLVGILLTLSSAALARECRGLLMGEGISSQTEKTIKAMIKVNPNVTGIFRMFSLYESPEEVLLVLVIAFRPELTTIQINDTITGIKKEIKAQFPKISYIIIQPQDDSEGALSFS
ncbi:MAG TPA: cation diffusion facilitator family transporter [Chitinophagaceae bacterium]|jgi:cation diffusion facilitator family transporter